MKREKKKKLNKKDRFKEVKKAPVPMHSAPLFIKNIYGIETITDSGIFQVGENIFSKLYRISISDPSVKAHDVFQVFRGYDFKFRIYYINEEIYLNVLFTSEKDNAWGTCDDLYKNMCSNLAEYSVMLEDIKANERFKLVHSIILDNADLPFNISYFDNTTVLDWKDTFELSGLEESVDIFKKKDSEYKIFYVREFSPKITDFIREIFDMREVKQIVTQFDPVSDMAVQAFFKKNYMGTENLLEDMIRNNPHVYDIYAKEVKDDSRYFTMCGVMFLVNVNDPDTESRIFFSANRYDVDISYFHVQLLDLYKELLPFGRWNISESRNMNSDTASKMFLPYYLASDKVGESVDDLMFDAETFDISADDFLNQDTNYSIDDYDVEDDTSDELTNDPVFKSVLEKDALASQPTVSRFFNRMDEDTLNQFLAIARVLRRKIYSIQMPQAVILDLDSTLLDAYGRQEGRAFNFHYQSNGYHPLVCYDGMTGDLIKIQLRDGTQYSCTGVVDFLQPVLDEYLHDYPEIPILLRGDSGFSTPDLYKQCEENGTSYVIRLKENGILRGKASDLVDELDEITRNNKVDYAVVYGEFMYKAIEEA